MMSCLRCIRRLCAPNVDLYELPIRITVEAREARQRDAANQARAFTTGQSPCLVDLARSVVLDRPAVNQLGARSAPKRRWLVRSTIERTDERHAQLEEIRRRACD